MLIAIAGLVLVVVFMASRPMPGEASATSLPDPQSVPATGTTGIPSPATMPNGHGFGNPLLATNAGQLIGQTNATLPATAWKGNPPLPPRSTVTSAPTSTPLLSKELVTQDRALSPLRTSGTLPTGWIKL